MINNIARLYFFFLLVIMYCRAKPMNAETLSFQLIIHSQAFTSETNHTYENKTNETKM